MRHRLPPFSLLSPSASSGPRRHGGHRPPGRCGANGSEVASAPPNPPSDGAAGPATRYHRPPCPDSRPSKAVRPCPTSSRWSTRSVRRVRSSPTRSTTRPWRRSSRPPPTRRAQRTASPSSSSSCATPPSAQSIGELTARLWQGGARAAEEDRLSPAFLRDVDRGAMGGIAAAPVLVVVCGDTRLTFAPAMDASVFPAVQNLLLAAHALGLGSTLTTLPVLGGDELSTLLGLPPEVVPVAVVPLGHLAEAARARPPAARVGEGPPRPLRQSFSRGPAG